jgi:hypothetical protein
VGFMKLVRVKLQRTGKIARLSFVGFLFVCLFTLFALFAKLGFFFLSVSFLWRGPVPLMAVPPLFLCPAG